MTGIDIGQVWQLLRHGPEKDERSLVKTMVGLCLYWRSWVASTVVLVLMDFSIYLVEAYGSSIAPVVMTLGVVTMPLSTWFRRS